GDDGRDQTRGGHVEPRIVGGGPRRDEPDRGDSTAGGQARYRGYLIAASFFDRDLRETIGECPVDGRARRRHVERHARVERGERFEIRADLVGDVAVRGGPIGPDNGQIDASALHQVTPGVVDD